MACSTCGCSSGCNCAQPANCPQCECTDPGSLTSFRHLSGYDYKLCVKRLENPEAGSFLVNNPTESGNAQITWTDSPCVLVPALTVAEGVRFGSILAALGDLGCFHRIIPHADADGYLQAVDGEWVIADLPAGNVPDPLTLQNLFVNVLATINDVTVTGQICAPNTPNGSIVVPLGLDVDGCIVQQAAGSGTSPLSTSKALYYENSSEISVATPNSGITNNGYAQIGNLIYTSDLITEIVNSTTIKITSAGKYQIDWSGVFTGGVGNAYTSAAARNLNLEINGGTAIPGNGPGATSPGATTNGDVNFPVTGMTLRTFAANDTIKLKCEGSATNNLLYKAKLLLTRYGS